MLRTNQVRSDLFVTSMARSLGSVVLTNSKEASPTSMLVPTPMLVFDLNSAGSMTFARMLPSPRPTPGSSDAPLPAPASEAEDATAPSAQAPSDEPVAVLQEAQEASDVSEMPPEVPALEPQPAIETHLVESEPPAAVAESRSPLEAHRVELIIDSLPHQQLTEAIPVTVDALGDQVFTATVGSLNLTGTGNTLGDALIIVKEQIELLYEKLSKARDLDTEEKKHLTFLQTHIKSTAPENSRHSKRSLWR